MILVEPQYLPSVNYFNNILNGEILFVGPKGGIYKISVDGKKKYV